MPLTIQEDMKVVLDRMEFVGEFWVENAQQEKLPLIYWMLIHKIIIMSQLQPTFSSIILLLSHQAYQPSMDHYKNSFLTLGSLEISGQEDLVWNRCIK